VGPGEYTVFIDAAREHGTYQSLRKTVTIAAEPFAEELKGNVEIKSAAVAYRRKPAAK
jgi:FAD:protein FMN transferase